MKRTLQRNEMKRKGILQVCSKIWTLFFVVWLLFGIFGSNTAQAAGERVYFGSESYEWTLDENMPLGVYAGANGNLKTADLIVSYDPEMLKFSEGADLIEPGKVRVRGTNIGAAEYKRILYFTPVMAGNTEITIQEAKVTNSNNEEVEPNTVSVPVSVTIPDSCKLEGIRVNGVPLSGFDKDKTDYILDVAEDAEQAEIELLPSDISAEISDTKLEAGENVIFITTTGTEGEKARYTVTVNRPEPAAPTVPDEDLPQADENQNEESSSAGDIRETVEKYFNYAREIIKNHLVLSAIVGVLIILFIILLIVRAHIRRERRRRALERRKRLQEKQKLWKAEQDSERKERSPDRKEPANAAKKIHKEGAEIAASEAADAWTADVPEEPSKKDMRETEIEVKHVTMDFKREKDESTSIKELVIRTLKRQRSFEYFRALDDISFTVKKGEVVGIIGTNGSGKSTILKIISGVLAPSKGKVEVDRHKIQLLTLGTGFDMELTGRENVYLNGAIIGYTKEYIDEKYDDIVKFAELEGFMEEKVRNYSSGMVSRLGFAIATVRDTPEILILDEVLSVGDMFFRKKSEARIQEMIHGGSTVLIVSHSTSVIRKNCTKVVWIERGKLRAVGDPKTVCEAYEKMNG